MPPTSAGGWTAITGLGQLIGGVEVKTKETKALAARRPIKTADRLPGATRGLATAPEDNQPHGQDASSPRSTLSRIAAELQSCRQTSKHDQARDATTRARGQMGCCRVFQRQPVPMQAWVGPLLCCSAFVPACRILVRPWFAFGHPAVSRWPVLRRRPHKTSSFPPCG